MPNLPISGLPTAGEITGHELFAIVQDGVTKKITDNKVQNYFIPSSLTVYNGANPNPEFYLTGSEYETMSQLKLSWTGVTGTCDLYLPDCTDPNNVNRVIGIISDGSFQSSTHADLRPLKGSGQTLDGETSVAYRINKAYEGIRVWSDGTEWFIIQQKA